MYALKISAAALSTACMLAACGGGGGGSADNVPISPASISLNLSSKVASGARQIMPADSGTFWADMSFSTSGEPVVITGMRFRKAGGTGSLAGNVEKLILASPPNSSYPERSANVTGEEIVFRDLALDLAKESNPALRLIVDTPPSFSEAGKTLQLELASVTYRLKSGEERTLGSLSVTSPEYVLHPAFPYAAFSGSTNPALFPSQQEIARLGLRKFGSGRLALQRISITVQGSAAGSIPNWWLGCRTTAYAGNREAGQGTAYRVTFPVQLELGTEDCRLMADIRSVATGAELSIRIEGDPSGAETAANGFQYEFYGADSVRRYSGTIAPYNEFVPLGWIKR